MDRLATLIPTIQAYINTLEGTTLTYKNYWTKDAMITIIKQKNEYIGKIKVEINDNKVFSAEYEITTPGYTYIIDYQIMGSPYVLKEKLI